METGTLESTMLELNSHADSSRTRRTTMMSSPWIGRASCSAALLIAVLSCLATETTSVQQKRQVYRGFHPGLSAHTVAVAVPVVAPAHQAPHKLTEEEKEAFRAAKRAYLGQDNKIPGQAGVDYPTFHEVPHTSFSCHDVPYAPGMYANVEAGCQAYHVCNDGREGEQGASFLCPNGTLFNQHDFNCDWWYNVDCGQARSLYNLNGDPEKNPYFPKKKPEDELAAQGFGIAEAVPVQYHQPQYQQVSQYQQYRSRGF